MRKNDTVWYKFILPFLALILILASAPEGRATHIRAGEITAKSDTAANPNPLRYYFKLVTYVVTSQNIPDVQGTMFFGDGTSQTVNREPENILPNNISRRVFYFSHVFPAPGNYTVLYNEQNRDAGIRNISLPSMNSFLLTTSITINPQIGINRSPQFSVPPLDVAAQGQIFIHFPGAYDLDQDSLSYRLVTPQRNTSGLATNPIAGNVTSYQLPNSPNFGGNAVADPVTGANQGDPARFDLNAVTGEIRWNTPGQIGTYNIALVVEEWKTVPGRPPVKLGQVTRDMQIRVEATNNIRPVLLVPRDTCVVANNLLQATITATDPNTPADPLFFNAYSGIIPPATFFQNSAEAARFRWTPQCTDISEQPYQVVFKVTDNPANGPDLIDMKSWNITVVGPKPTGLTATLLPGKRMQLNWNPYLVNGCGNAEKIHIYRRVNKANFIPTNCETGVPASTGYVKVGEVAAGVSTFTDDNGGKGLKSGANYCYVIYASFPAPKRGESLASEEICAEVPVLASLLTNVDVTQTSKTTGEIVVKWSRPLIGVPTAPFTYRLSRAIGLRGSQGYTQVFSSSVLNDTIFTDRNLNTQDSTYRYKIEYFETGPQGPTLLEEGSEASQARLTALSDGTNMDLKWEYETPWDNSQRKHIIYRRVNNGFVAIDSVKAGPTIGTYTDRGTYNNEPLKFGSEYCYYIETVGVYTNPKLPPVVRNRSQIFCQIVKDTTAPCPPVLSLALLNCDSLERSPFRPPFTNKLKWEPATGNNCGTDVAGYNVYTRPSVGGDFQFLTNTPSLAYVHQNLQSPAACYVVTAVDSSGNESKYSNLVCQEVCLFLELPNIISPNNDNLNDTFRPKNSAFIQSVKFTVYNRWGIQIYSQTTGPSIEWAGVNDNGNRIPDGVYYYLAEVEFASPDPEKARRVYKGWVEVVR